LHADSGNISLLILLDHREAFNTLDYNLLLNYLEYIREHICETVNSDCHGVSFHTEIYVSMRPDDPNTLPSLTDCMSVSNEWMSKTFLKLNEDKSAIFLVGVKKKRDCVFLNSNVCDEVQGASYFLLKIQEAFPFFNSDPDCSSSPASEKFSDMPL
uniref:Reverse transcriptase domain-containing protein n=1 Tax=Amphiprion percula TaxID=161767 RepID=A0A3P8RRF7_AMPPE